MSDAPADPEQRERMLGTRGPIAGYNKATRRRSMSAARAAAMRDLGLKQSPRSESEFQAGLDYEQKHRR